MSWKTWAALGAGAVALAAIFRKDVGAATEAVAQEASSVASSVSDEFRQKIGLLPSAAQQYVDVIAQVAAESGEKPAVLSAIGWRESKWGTARALDQQGPGGTGDFVARTGHWLNGNNVQVGFWDSENQVPALPSGWYPPKNSAGDVISGPYAIPSDGRGWGRGLMQIDFDRAMTVQWDDPLTNVRTGAQILGEKRAYISSHVAELTPDELERATVAAYNHGEGGSVNNLLAGRSIDSGTTGGNYSTDVMGNAERWS